MSCYCVDIFWEITLFFSWQDLKDFMRKAGEVCYGAAHGDIGKNKGVVCYDRKEDAQRAVEELEGRDINGRAIELKFVVRDDWDTGDSRRKYFSIVQRLTPSDRLPIPLEITTTTPITLPISIQIATKAAIEIPIEVPVPQPLRYVKLF